jgi:hypothetical protein
MSASVGALGMRTRPVTESPSEHAWPSENAVMARSRLLRFVTSATSPTKNAR